MEDTIVTRGNQITLTKGIREKLSIKEGDKLVLNVDGGLLMISKKNSGVFDDFKEFLPSRFESVLRSIRNSENERLKRLGIIE
ncbi:MAG TPA: AbrB/MazE/SpoVT family DNA-binding domain-containing protein [Candidatus Nanoarchaeia archaeon]|nr:AbrB/MazE/SpoVT family DNA-binding domain-containing protein [Candidatus Nanoarchaeia archaeon]